jgi:isoleucyl-tRNA synthetase
MAAVQRVISLGLAARQTAKIGVKQPLAELVVSAGSDADTRAVERFPDLILDELNVKRVSLHAGTDPLLKASAKLNKKTAAAKLGPKLKDAEAALDRMDARKVEEELRAGTFTLAGVAIDPADVTIGYLAAQGWAGVADKGSQVAINTTITEDLKLEGLARVVIRQVQDTRKNAGLDLLDKIALYLQPGSDELAKAIKAHQHAIATAVQATEWSETALNGEAHTATVKIEGQPLTIALRKV